MTCQTLSLLAVVVGLLTLAHATTRVDDPCPWRTAARTAAAVVLLAALLMKRRRRIAHADGGVRRPSPRRRGPVCAASLMQGAICTSDYVYDPATPVITPGW